MPPTMPATHGGGMGGEAQSPALLGVLAAIRRKARALSVAYGAGLVLAAAVGLILALVLLDWLLELPAVPRVALLLVALGAIGYLAWRFVIRSAMAEVSLGHVAGRVEDVFPQFQDRLRSTVDFVRSEVPGSEFMKRRVVAEAERDAAAVRLEEVLAYRPVAWALGLGGAALALLVGLALAFPLARTIATNRLLGGDQKWPRTQQIDVLAMPQKVAAGQKFDLTMRLAKGDKPSVRATVFYKYDNGTVQKQIMNRNADGTYSVSLDARGSKMTVWMEAGDDDTRPQTITVVERLAITRVEAIVRPPAYAGSEALPAVNLSEAPAAVVFNSQVTLRAWFNKPLAADKPVVVEAVKPGGPVPQVRWTPAAPNVAAGTFTARETVRFRIRATDQDYFQNTALEEYEVAVRPDQSPTVVIELPRKNLDCTPVALVRLEALAEDDFDISTMTLMVERVGENKREGPAATQPAGAGPAPLAGPATRPAAWRGAEIPLAGWERVDSNSGDRRRFRAKYEWELSELRYADGKPFDLKPGDVLEYWVRVTDNYEYNGVRHEPVDSGKLKINVISQEALEVQITEAMRVAMEKARVLKARQDTTRQETRNVQEGTEKKPEVDAADRTAMSRLSDQQGTIGSQTRQLSQAVSELERRMEDNRSTNGELKDIVRDVRTTLKRAADEPMSEASKELGKAADKSDPKASNDPKTGKPDPAKQQENAAQRNEALKQAQASQQQASEQLDKALQKMSNLGTLEAMINQVRQALADQQALSKKTQETGREMIGKKPEELTPEQKKALDDLAKEQQKLAEKTEKLTEQLEKAGERNQKADPASSQAMRQAAQQSRQQQVQQNQQQAAQQAQENQQAQAQARQKSAELGLQMMLDTLREAERRKLEQLARELMKLQEQIANLIRRQAGHNVDNLRLQGVEGALKLMTDDLLAKAERVRDKQPKVPDLTGLTGSQITTEKNSRDVSKEAEAMQKGGAEIAALLAEAARLMERAILALKEDKLPEAYDPSQVRALAKLEEARNATDKALEEVRDEQDMANRESIREVYEKVRAEQEALNKETKRIEEAPKREDGSLRREDAVALGRLPGQQGQLAERIAELEKSLQDLGGVVYVWSNKDIVDSMNRVKKDLAKPATGQATQKEQKRVVDQLTAMIESLKLNPKKTDFHQAGGGGGGGGGQPPKPRLPSEAELRLLKALQLAINDATKAEDAAGRKDKGELTALGTRQFELRNLLDELIQKASRGQVKLDEMPDPKQRLPEEADEQDVEDQELEDWLRGAKSGDDQMADDIKLAGQRMGRSHQRLGTDHDPGKVTQIIQKRILDNLDHLIDMARAQQAQSRPQQGQGRPQQGNRPQDGDGQQMGQQQVGQQPGRPLGEQSQPNQGQTPAETERGGGSQDNTADLSKDIREKAAEWGSLTPRERDALIEGRGDTILEKYKRLTERYYEAVSRKATENR